MGGYIEAFLDLQQNAPHVLSGLDDNDWAQIFLKLPPPRNGEEIDLASMFSGLSVKT